MKKQSRPKVRVRKPKRDHLEMAWERRFAELKAYRRQYGHAQVPSTSLTHPSLGHWVQHQRVLQRSGRLSAARSRQLDKFGFDWVSRGRSLKFRDSTHWDAKWGRMLDRLAAFHRRFGHCRVPPSFPGKPNLRQWTDRQRRLKEQGILLERRWQRLKTLGVDWRAGDSVPPRWERCFLRLVEFRRRFGHTHVPAEWKENFNLGRWVVKTRRLRKAGRLSAGKLRRLNEVGFVWNPLEKRLGEHDVLWSAKLATLKKFHQRHRHWRVPTDQPALHSLRVWMDNQRISYTRNWLTADRIARLEAIKFPWVSVRAAAKAGLK